MKQKRFNVYAAEINRRVYAYISLALSWPVMVACGSVLLPAAKQAPALLLSACIFVVMFVIGALTLPFLRKAHLHTVYELWARDPKRLASTDVKEIIELDKSRKFISNMYHMDQSARLRLPRAAVDSTTWTERSNLSFCVTVLFRLALARSSIVLLC